MAFRYSPRIVTDGLVFYLDAASTKSYPRSGTNILDLSGNDLTSVLENGTSFSNNNAGVITLAGDDDYINPPTNDIFEFTGNFSYSIWVKFNSLSGSHQMLIDSSSNANFGYGYSMYMRESDEIIRCWAYAAGLGNLLDSTYTVETGTWYNFTFTYELATKHQMLYWNGDFNVENNHIAASGVSDSTYLNFGYGAVYSGLYLNGDVGPIMMYNKELSDTEVLQNYNAMKSRFGL